jgi:hypothetical protein
MADEKPASESGDQGASPAPEELAPQSDADSSAPQSAQIVTQAAKRRHAAYRPSHKATFIGLAVIAFILAANGAALAFLLKGQGSGQQANEGSVTLSSSTLDKLGVSRDNADNQGVTLKINPATNFGNNVTVSNDLSVGGTLSLNGKFTAPSAAFNQLQGGQTALDTLNVNGDATASTLNLRKDLIVVGTTTLQGQVKVSQLMTVNNNVNVSGTLAVGGALTVQTLQVGNFQTTGNLTFGGHFIANGASPSASKGNALGSNGTISVSGNDAAGTVFAGVGVNAIAGTVATVTFARGYSDIPHIVLSVSGGPAPNIYIVKSGTGFSIVTTSGLAPGSYGFDYIVVQ